MLLLDLPSELLAAIFTWIGPEFFQNDVRRLPVCRKWYSFAISELLKDVEISSEKLYRLLHSKRKKQSLELLRSHAKNICFKTGGFYTLQANRSDDEEKKLEPLKQWVRYLHDHHRDIPTILADCTRLQGLTFTAERYRYGFYTWEDMAENGCYWLTLTAPGDDILSTAIQDIISIAYTHNLTSLELDLRGSECVTPRDHAGLGHGQAPFLHLCPLLACLLSRRHMRRLLLCLPCVCPTLLQPASGFSEIWLEEFVLHITPIIGKHSKVCYMNECEASPETFEGLAKGMLSRMVHPKVVKVVSHSGPPLPLIDIAYYLRVFDAINNTSINVEYDHWHNFPSALSTFKYY